MRFRAEILTIGAELLKGSTLNTNACFLGRELTDLGFEVAAQTACGDSQEAIAKKMGEAISRCDLLILTGGLGPTPDDVTREAVAGYFQTPLIFSKSQFSLIQKYYRSRRRQVPSLVRREVMFPENATPLINRYGVALGFYLVYGRTLVVVLPGVPAELEKMFRELVRSLIRRHFRGLKSCPSLVAKIVGLSEPEIMLKLGRDFFKDRFDFGIYPAPGEVAIRIQAEDPAIVRRCRQKIKLRLGPSLYAETGIVLTEAVGRILRRRRQSLAIAESCTGGLVAAEITKIPGASRFFKGGRILYDNRVKNAWFKSLGRRDAVGVLRKEGAVSPGVVRVLAAGIRQEMNSTFGIGITGIAGPGGGSRRKPVGLVFLALATPSRTKVWKEHFWGDRIQVQTKAMKKALEYLWREIR